MITIPVHDLFSAQANEESDQASDQVIDLIFNIIEDVIVYSDRASDRASVQASAQAKDILRQFVHGKVNDILTISDTWISREQILENIGLSNHHKNKVKYIDPLVEYGWFEMKYPDNRTYPEQQYKISESGKRLLSLIN